MPVRPYEVVYIIDPDVNEENTGALVERFRALVEAQGASEIRVDTQTLGRRRLAYEINHKREGQYVVMNFQSEANAPDEVERVLNITDSILRSMVIRLEEMPPEPVAAPAPAPAPAAEPVAETAAEQEPAAEAEPTGEMEDALEAAPEAAPEPVEPADEQVFPTPLPDEDKQGQELTDATEPDQPAS